MGCGDSALPIIHSQQILSAYNIHNSEFKHKDILHKDTTLDLKKFTML